MTKVYPTFDKLIPREEKEALLNQKGSAYWLYGQSGSGKTTIAIELEKQLHAQGQFAFRIECRFGIFYRR